MSKNMKYPFESLTEVYKVEDNLKTMLNNRIAELEKDGFCMDLRMDKDGKTIFDYIRKSFCDPQGSRYDPTYRVEDDFDILRKYTMSNEDHMFVHVKPDNFSFRYIDFQNMRSVFNTSSETIVYSNSFWGIYIRNDHLRLHDLVQYDIFQKYFDIHPYNIYDGGKQPSLLFGRM